jgi:uncharacterized membrane protein YphA (DoxX/SURF4 family)
VRRPIFDVVGVFLATAAAGLLVMMTVIFVGAKAGLNQDIYQFLSGLGGLLVGIYTWSWFLRRHQRNLREYENKSVEEKNEMLNV